MVAQGIRSKFIFGSYDGPPAQQLFAENVTLPIFFSSFKGKER
jgi:hypothetical protein